jgi:ADP-ribose pyrophosphatase YjhB (NUDIX family)
MCISAFALVRRGGKFLLGIPRQNQRWISEWISAWAVYSKEELEEAFTQWRLPSCYIREGEHPEDAVRRVIRDQLGLKKFTVSGPRVFSYAWPSDWYPGNDHWDLVLVYRVKTSERIKRLPWWKELSFVGKDDLRHANFGWNDDLMKDLKIA